MLAFIDAHRDAYGVESKFALVAPAIRGGNVASRYFVPWNCHSAYAVTGAMCLGAACCIPGTVANAAARLHDDQPGLVVIEHPAGKLEPT